MSANRFRYRAWDHGCDPKNKPKGVVTGEMVYVDHLSWDKEGILQEINNEMTRWFSSPMQSTGLCDRKGNELWEGDIVESYDFLGKPLGRYKIVWGHFGFSMQDPAQPEAYNYVALELIERVGNVWENPELLV